jgi:2-methylcitrate dehydratase PrpD
MRGIPPEKKQRIKGKMVQRRQLHNSKIREIWDRHYRNLDAEIKARKLKPGTPQYKAFVRQYLTEGRKEVDYVLGQFFSEYRATMFEEVE